MALQRLGLKILADVHEPEDSVVGPLRALGVHVEIVALPVADYIVAEGVLVERKTVRDLHDSVVQGRYWLQLGRLRRSCDRPYLLLEGVDVDRGRLGQESIRGVYLATLDMGVPIIRSADGPDSARWLRRLAIRAGITRPRPDRPAYDQRPKRKEDPAEAVLAAVPGISVRMSRALLTEFGSVAGVIEAGPEHWLDVRGVGRARGAALAKALF